MHSNLMVVRVDHREGKSGTVDVLRRMDGVEVVVEHLSLGDYEVDGRLLFERKTLLDLVASIKDGRLFRQATRLAAAPLRSVLILEGTARDLAASGMRREAIQGALITITILLGIPLLRAKDAEESARLMSYAARQLRTLHKAGSKAAYPRSVPAKRPRGKRKTQLYILQGLPGIGPKRAQRLLEQFGSVEATLLARVEDLTTISGIGTRTAKAIRWSVSEQAAAYGLHDDDPVL